MAVQSFDIEIPNQDLPPLMVRQRSPGRRSNLYVWIMVFIVFLIGGLAGLFWWKPALFPKWVQDLKGESKKSGAGSNGGSNGAGSNSGTAESHSKIQGFDVERAKIFANFAAASYSTKTCIQGWTCKHCSQEHRVKDTTVCGPPQNEDYSAFVGMWEGMPLITFNSGIRKPSDLKKLFEDSAFRMTTKFEENDDQNQVNKYLWKAFKALDTCIKDAITKLGGAENVRITGHGIGGGIASVAAGIWYLDNKFMPKEVYTFGAPHIGSAEFSMNAFQVHFGKTNPNNIFWRVTHANDLVVREPVKLLKKYQGMIWPMVQEAYFKIGDNDTGKPTICASRDHKDCSGDDTNQIQSEKELPEHFVYLGIKMTEENRICTQGSESTSSVTSSASTPSIGTQASNTQSETAVQGQTESSSKSTANASTVNIGTQTSKKQSETQTSSTPSETQTPSHVSDSNKIDGSTTPRFNSRGSAPSSLSSWNSISEPTDYPSNYFTGSSSRPVDDVADDADENYRPLGGLGGRREGLGGRGPGGPWGPRR